MQYVYCMTIVQKAASTSSLQLCTSCAPHCAGHSRDFGVHREVTQSVDPKVLWARAQWKITDHLATQAGFKAPLHLPYKYPTHL